MKLSCGLWRMNECTVGPNSEIQDRRLVIRQRLSTMDRSTNGFEDDVVVGSLPRRHDTSAPTEVAGAMVKREERERERRVEWFAQMREKTERWGMRWVPGLSFHVTPSTSRWLKWGSLKHFCGNYWEPCLMVTLKKRLKKSTFKKACFWKVIFLFFFFKLILNWNIIYD